MKIFYSPLTLRTSNPSPRSYRMRLPAKENDIQCYINCNAISKIV